MSISISREFVCEPSPSARTNHRSHQHCEVGLALVITVRRLALAHCERLMLGCLVQSVAPNRSNVCVDTKPRSVRLAVARRHTPLPTRMTKWRAVCVSEPHGDRHRSSLAISPRPNINLIINECNKRRNEQNLHNLNLNSTVQHT